jgi:6-phosphogluconolactonase (cycloisomerase 2 family)
MAKRDQRSRCPWLTNVFFAVTITAPFVFQACGSSSVQSSQLFAYVTNPMAGTLTAYTINTSGTLVPLLGSPINIGGAPYAAAADPRGRYLYVGTVESGFGAMDAYSIDARTGALTKEGSSLGIAPPGPGVLAIAFHPSGKWLYTAGPGSRIYGFNIDPNTGALSALNGSPFTDAGGVPNSITLNSAGSFAFASNPGPENVTVFSVGSTSGQLTEAGPPFSFVSAQWATSDKSGAYLYVMSSLDENVHAFGIGPTGNLGPLSPPTYHADGEPIFSTLSPNGQFLYVINTSTSSPQVQVFSINSSTGGLTEINGSPFLTAGDSKSINFTPSGQSAYITSENTDTVWEYPVNPTTGALGTPSQIASGGMPTSIAVAATHP